MQRNPAPNFVFKASRLEHRLQGHFPGAEVQIVTPKPPADLRPALHSGKIIARMPLEHFSKGEDPIVRTGVNLKIASRDREFIRQIAIALKKAHDEMQG